MVVGDLAQEVELLIIGAGPGGYVAACAAADHGMEVALIERAEVPGGVCLREGCIPSKALLHVAKIINEARHATDFGVDFGKPQLDIDKLRNWKSGVIRKLSGGVKSLLAGRKVDYHAGRAEFIDSRTVRVEGAEFSQLKFKHCIIATGSVAKFLPESVLPRELCWDAADALALKEVPARLLVVGGGYIGMELGQVYATLGSEVAVVEALPAILTGGDADLVKPLVARLGKQFKAIHTNAQLKGAQKSGSAVRVTFTANGADKTEEFDRVLVSVGRKPLTEGLGLQNTRVKLDDRGFIVVDGQRRTTDKRIYAIGDVAGEPMLAHKASHEAKVAVEAIAGKPAVFNPACIPAVVYTDPEVAWCGLTESDAKQRGLNVRVTRFPWIASGRAVAMSRTEGLTKLIFDEKTQRLIGAGLVGAHAGDLISELALAIEMAAVAEDVCSTIHPHPSTSETIMEAAESMFGKAIHTAQ